jgi:hypothetical protein
MRVNSTYLFWDFLGACVGFIIGSKTIYSHPYQTLNWGIGGFGLGVFMGWFFSKRKK